jgi:hypothetical protein
VNEKQPKKETMKKQPTKAAPTASQLITNQIAELNDWRGAMLAQLRKLIHEADPELTEEWKWNTAVWTRNGLICAAGAFKDHVKVNFFKGASLKDPKHLFNPGLEAKATRAIDFSEGANLNAAALKDLIRAAVAYNLSAKPKN